MGRHEIGWTGLNHYLAYGIIAYKTPKIHRFGATQISTADDACVRASVNDPESVLTAAFHHPLFLQLYHFGFGSSNSPSPSCPICTAMPPTHDLGVLPELVALQIDRLSLPTHKSDTRTLQTSSTHMHPANHGLFHCSKTVRSIQRPRGQRMRCCYDG
jgi:hypothetical protein